VGQAADRDQPESLLATACAPLFEPILLNLLALLDISYTKTLVLEAVHRNTRDVSGSRRSYDG
jgi:hypothetical protein